MGEAPHGRPARPAESGGGGRLNSWKEIAAYLGRTERTVQRWEEAEGLPVHRHIHEKKGSVYAYRAELDAWWSGQKAKLAAEAGGTPERKRLVKWKWAAGVAAVLVAGAIGIWLARQVARETDRDLTAVPLTADPGWELWPTFSPDGNRVVFAGSPKYYYYGSSGESVGNWLAQRWG